jgi:hypothetical protein
MAGVAKPSSSCVFLLSGNGTGRIAEKSDDETMNVCWKVRGGMVELIYHFAEILNQWEDAIGWVSNGT